MCRRMISHWPGLSQKAVQQVTRVYLHACNSTLIKLEGPEVSPIIRWQKTEYTACS